MYSQAASSTEFVRCPVAGSVDGQPINPTSDVVQLALVPAGSNPTQADWLSGDWETTASGYFARVLVGPDGVITLDPGLFDVFVRVEDNPETPIRRSGAVWIF